MRKEDKNQKQETKNRPTRQGKNQEYLPPCIESISTFDTLLLTCKLSAAMHCTKIQSSRSAA